MLVLQKKLWKQKDKESSAYSISLDTNFITFRKKIDPD